MIATLTLLHFFWYAVYQLVLPRSSSIRATRSYRRLDTKTDLKSRVRAHYEPSCEKEDCCDSPLHWFNINHFLSTLYCAYLLLLTVDVAWPRERYLVTHSCFPRSKSPNIYLTNRKQPPDGHSTTLC